MSSMTAETLMSVYPPVLDKDQLFNALGRATAEVLGQAFMDTKHASIYTRIAELDEALLDVLAKDFNIAWYDYNHPLEIKRRVIAAAFSVYFNNGTKGALETAIRAIYPNAVVEEWFDYGGLPYHFRVIINDQDPDYNTIQKMIRLYKNERSYLDSISYSSEEVIMPVYLGSSDGEAVITEESEMM